MPVSAAKALRFIRGRIARADPLVQKASRRQTAPSKTGANALARSGNPYIPHLPTERQAMFLALLCREALYGGAAGGGKSDALLMAALQYVHVPGYAAIIFRRTFADLAQPKALIVRAHEWLDGTEAKWVEREHRWYFPSGATLSFGYIDSDRDLNNYQGAEFQFVGFDELTQFPEKWYRFLFSRLRRLRGALVPIRMRGATNPGGIGHVWVKQRFKIEGKSFHHAAPLFSPDASGDPLGRAFVPALLRDNPHVDREEYEASLTELDPTLKAQLLEGDWDAATPGKLFRREWFTGKFVKERPSGGTWVRIWDLAATEPSPSNMDPDWSVGLLLGRVGTDFYIGGMKRFRKGPGQVKQSILATAYADRRAVRVRIEQEPGSSGKAEVHGYITALAGFDVVGRPSSGSKEVRARPAAAQAQAGNLYIVEGDWDIAALLDELEAFPGGAHDDIVDTLSGGIEELTAGKSKKAVLS